MILGENDVVLFFRLLITIVLVPGVGLIIWYIKRLQTQSDERNRKQLMKIEELEKKQSMIERDQAVAAVMMHHLQADIREIKEGIKTMLDRRRFSRDEKSSDS